MVKINKKSKSQKRRIAIMKDTPKGKSKKVFKGKKLKVFPQGKSSKIPKGRMPMKAMAGGMPMKVM